MDFCFVDESGSAETLDPSQPSSTPVFVVVGLLVQGDHLRQLNWEYLKVKESFARRKPTEMKLSDLVQMEVKGAELRADFRSGTRSRIRRATGLLDRTFDLLERHHCQVVARVITKDTGVALVDDVMYSSATRWLCGAFQNYLEHRQSTGIMILDSRTKVKNTPNAVSVTTQMYRTGGDPLPRLAEVPVFGHSDSHIALQVADLLASAIVFPAACAAYAMDHGWNQHAHESYRVVRLRYGVRLKRLQFRYFDASAAHWKGGVHVTGPATGAKVSAVSIFTEPDMGAPRLPLEFGDSV